MTIDVDKMREPTLWIELDRLNERLRVTQESEGEIQDRRAAVARALIAKGPRGTQRAIAARSGVSKSAVRLWMEDRGGVRGGRLKPNGCGS